MFTLLGIAAGTATYLGLGIVARSQRIELHRNDEVGLRVGMGHDVRARERRRAPRLGPTALTDLTHDPEITKCGQNHS